MGSGTIGVVPQISELEGSRFTLPILVICPVCDMQPNIGATTGENELRNWVFVLQMPVSSSPTFATVRTCKVVVGEVLTEPGRFVT